MTATLSTLVGVELIHINRFELQNATGNVLNSTQSATDNDREITLSASPDTDNVFIDGSIDIRSPSVNADKNYLFKLNATDADGSQGITEPFTLDIDPLTVSSAEPFDPPDVSEDVRNFNSNHDLYVEGRGQLGTRSGSGSGAATPTPTTTPGFGVVALAAAALLAVRHGRE